jgi:hypothetical protein
MKILSKLIAACIVLLISALGMSSASAVVIWDESINGDLFYSDAAQNIGNLQFGTNTLLGSGYLIRNNGVLVGVDVDEAFFTLAAGLQIDSMTSVLTFLSESPGSVLQTRYTALISPSSSNIFVVDMVSNVTSIDLLPYNTAGSFLFATGGGGASTPDNTEIYWNWKADINVSSVMSPVPEPQTYAMLLAGLGLIGFMARRREDYKF